MRIPALALAAIDPEPGDEIIEDAMVDGSEVYLITQKWSILKLKVEGASASVVKSGAIQGAPERTPCDMVPGARKDELAVVAINDRANVTVIVDLNSWSVRKRQDRAIHSLKRYGSGYASLDFFKRTLSLLDADLGVISEVMLKRPEDTLIYWGR